MGQQGSGISQEELHGEVARLVAHHQIPGLVVAQWQGGSMISAAAGIANLNTDAAMTVDTGFLTGSVTKVWGTTLVMTLVQDGLLELDRPIVDYAPEMQFGADVRVA